MISVEIKPTLLNDDINFNMLKTSYSGRDFESHSELYDSPKTNFNAWLKSTA